MMELNQKITKSTLKSIRRLLQGIYKRNKKIGVKEGEGICLKGMYFRELRYPSKASACSSFGYKTNKCGLSNLQP